MIKRTSEAFLAVKSADVNGVEALASSSPFSAIAEGTAKRQGGQGLEGGDLQSKYYPSLEALPVERRFNKKDYIT